MKSINEYLELPYTYELKKESDGTFFISVKELTGCMSVGDTREEAFKMIKDAMETWIEYCLDNGISVPEPEDETVKTYSGKFVTRVSPSLHKELVEGAKRDGVSLNHRVAELLSRKSGIIGQQKEIIDQLAYSFCERMGASVSSGSGKLSQLQVFDNTRWVKKLTYNSNQDD